MSRREEVGQMITVHKRFVEAEKMENPARCVDEMSVYLERFARTLADEVDARDAIIDKLIAMLEPKKPCPKHEDFVPFDYNKWNDATCAWMRVDDLHTRACEIAGRAKT